MKILTAAFLMVVMLLGISAILTVRAAPSDSSGSLCSMGKDSTSEQEDSCAPLIECDDPAQTGRNFCAKGWAISACEYACANKAKDQCDWSPNSVANCKAQCTTRNGCTAN